MNQAVNTRIFVSVIKDVVFPADLFKVISQYDKAFYFEQPDKKITYCGLGKLIDLSSESSAGFASLKNNFEGLSLQFANEEFQELDFPVVLGGMKFPGSGTSEGADHWSDYSESDWFIPEVLLMKKNGTSYMINFRNEEHTDHLEGIELLNSWVTKVHSEDETPEAYLVKNIMKYKWHLLVEKAIAEIRKGIFSKVVLSRKVELDIKGKINFRYVISDLREKYPSCTLFLFKSRGSCFFGASPETAASVKDGFVDFDALAGSAPRGIDRMTDSRYEKYLLNSSKDRDEHNYVINYIKEETSDLVSDFSVTETVVKKYNNIQHLFTGIRAMIKEPGMIFNLLERVIPTPALCGLPKKAALDFIAENEGYSRGLYSGTIGWFNLKYEGEFMAALRSALYKNDKLSIFAGCGIVEHSDPAKEFEETELKLQPIISIFI